MSNEPFSIDEDQFANVQDDTTREVINIAHHPVKFEVDGTVHVMKPREVRRFPKAYVEDHKFQASGAVVHSPIHQMTGGNVLPLTHKNARPIVEQMKLEAASKAGMEAAKK